MVLLAKPHLNQHVLLWSPGLRKQLMNNAFTNIGWITTCLEPGNENKWAYSMYSFMKMPGDKILMISISVPGSVKTKELIQLMKKKLPSTDFIEQLYLQKFRLRNNSAIISPLWQKFIFAQAAVMVFQRSQKLRCDRLSAFKSTSWTPRAVRFLC